MGYDLRRYSRYVPLVLTCEFLHCFSTVFLCFSILTFKGLFVSPVYIIPHLQEMTLYFYKQQGGDTSKKTLYFLIDVTMIELKVRSLFYSIFFIWRPLTFNILLNIFFVQRLLSDFFLICEALNLEFFDLIFFLSQNIVPKDLIGSS